jgi:hypothetical protein
VEQAERNRRPNTMKIVDSLPKGDTAEGFFDRDTGTRDVLLVHPSCQVLKKLQKEYDVYVHRLTPPDAAYIVQRDAWDQFLENLNQSVEDLQRGYRRSGQRI